MSVRIATNAAAAPALTGVNALSTVPEPGLTSSQLLQQAQSSTFEVMLSDIEPDFVKDEKSLSQRELTERRDQLLRGLNLQGDMKP